MVTRPMGCPDEAAAELEDHIECMVQAFSRGEMNNQTLLGAFFPTKNKDRFEAALRAILTKNIPLSNGSATICCAGEGDGEKCGGKCELDTCCDDNDACATRHWGWDVMALIDFAMRPSEHSGLLAHTNDVVTVIPNNPDDCPVSLVWDDSIEWAWPYDRCEHPDWDTLTEEEQCQVLSEDPELPLIVGKWVATILTPELLKVPGVCYPDPSPGAGNFLPISGAQFPAGQDCYVTTGPVNLDGSLYDGWVDDDHFVVPGLPHTPSGVAYPIVDNKPRIGVFNPTTGLEYFFDPVTGYWHVPGDDKTDVGEIVWPYPCDIEDGSGLVCLPDGRRGAQPKIFSVRGTVGSADPNVYNDGAADGVTFVRNANGPNQLSEIVTNPSDCLSMNLLVTYESGVAWSALGGSGYYQYNQARNDGTFTKWSQQFAAGELQGSRDATTIESYELAPGASLTISLHSQLSVEGVGGAATMDIDLLTQKLSWHGTNTHA